MPSACAPTVGRVASKVCHRRLRLAPSCLRGRGRGARRASPCRRAGRQPGTRQSSRWTSAVCEARRPCFLTLAPCSQPRRARRDDEGGVTARAELAVDRGDDDVDVGDAAVGRPRLLAVEDPLVRRLVVLGASCGSRRRRSRRRARTSRTRRPWGRPRVPKHCGIHSPICSGGALAEDRGDGERGAHDRHADAGVAPEQLLVDDRQRQARSGRTRTAPSASKP